MLASACIADKIASCGDGVLLLVFGSLAASLPELCKSFSSVIHLQGCCAVVVLSAMLQQNAFAFLRAFGWHHAVAGLIGHTAQTCEQALLLRMQCST